jgi:hypothetical protein
VQEPEFWLTRFNSEEAERGTYAVLVLLVGAFLREPDCLRTARRVSLRSFMETAAKSWSGDSSQVTLVIGLTG